MLVPTKAQEQIARSSARFKLLRSGRRFGKTMYAIEDIVATAVTEEGKVLYIAPTQSQARDIVWDILKNRTKDFAESQNEQRLEIRVPNQHGTESLIMLGSWEKVENLRGNEFVHIVLDEVREMKKAPGFFYYWKNTLKPTLLTTKGTADFLSTPNGYDHFYELEQKALDDTEWEVFHFTSYDNPHNDHDELKKLEKTEDPDTFAQEYLAEYRKKQGLVYSDFNETRHVIEKDVEVGEYLAGLDFGFVHPTALIEVYYHDRTYYIMDEYYETGKTDEEIAEYVSGKNFEKVYPDPAKPEAIEVLKRNGVYCMDVIKGKDSVIKGIKKVQDLFRTGRIKIHRRCENLLWELSMYEYDANKDKPVKEHDHALDALRYLVTMHNSDSKNTDYLKEVKYWQRRQNKGRNYSR